MFLFLSLSSFFFKKTKKTKTKIYILLAPYRSPMNFLLFISLCVACNSQATCDSYSDEMSCLKGNSWGCDWCESKTVPSSCKDWATASKLPKSVFNCGNATRNDCSSFKTNETCADNVGCGWCVCAAVPSSCKPWAEASKLPPSVFSCTGPY